MTTAEGEIVTLLSAARSVCYSRSHSQLLGVKGLQGSHLNLSQASA